MNYLTKLYIVVLLGLLMVFLLLTYMNFSLHGQNTSLNNYGADKDNDTNKKDIRDLVTVQTKGKIYT